MLPPCGRFWDNNGKSWADGTSYSPGLRGSKEETPASRNVFGAILPNLPTLSLSNIMYETSCQSRFDAQYWMLGAGTLGRPRGMVWGGRREEGSGWGAHVYL